MNIMTERTRDPRGGIKGLIRSLPPRDRGQSLQWQRRQLGALLLRVTRTITEDVGELKANVCRTPPDALSTSQYLSLQLLRLAADTEERAELVDRLLEIPVASELAPPAKVRDRREEIARRLMGKITA